MRLLLSPKWLAWHVLTLGAMVTCGWLAAWQWGRAGSAMGSALNIGYGLQWPVFAVFFGVMWWRFLRMEIASLRETEAADGTDAPEDDPAAAGDERPGDADVSDQTDAPAVPAARSSPFTPRPAGVTASGGSDPQLRAYNEELARLAARQEETTQ